MILSVQTAAALALGNGGPKNSVPIAVVPIAVVLNRIVQGIVDKNVDVVLRNLEELKKRDAELKDARGLRLLSMRNIGVSQWNSLSEVFIPPAIAMQTLVSGFAC